MTGPTRSSLSWSPSATASPRHGHRCRSIPSSASDYGRCSWPRPSGTASAPRRPRARPGRGGGHAGVREPRRSFFGRSGARRIRARGAIVIGVAAGAMAISGISAASENAEPGDALYGVKRSTEKAQLAMAGSDVTRGQLSLDFARTRLAEAAAMPGDNAAISGVLTDMDADTRQGVKLLTGAAVAGEDTAPLTRVDGFVAG